MRGFVDRNGGRWDVVLGRESFGALLALFVPAGPADARAVRQAPLRAVGYDEAERELASLDDAGLQSLFDGSKPKES